MNISQKLNYSNGTGTFLFHVVASVTPTHELLSPPFTIFSTCLGDDRRTPVSDLEAVARDGGRGGKSRTSSITLCFSLQCWSAQCLKHSLWDALDDSVLGAQLNTKWKQKDSLCFINCYYQHLQIDHISLTNLQPFCYFGGRKRRRMLDCHCSSVTVHFLYNMMGFFFFLNRIAAYM